MYMYTMILPLLNLLTVNLLNIFSYMSNYTLNIFTNIPFMNNTYYVVEQIIPVNRTICFNCTI